uniref:Homeobox domain-containing protein n=1 Tax=Anopheles dirus TaxID=7168 RepID=A0A182N5C7_9DIPT
SPRVWPFYPHPYSYLLPACGSKRKGGQVRFTPQQTQSLEKRFSNHKYLSPEDRRNLAIQLKLSDRQVKTWFQNRRAKWRRANSGCQSTDVLGSPDGLGDTSGSKVPAGVGSSATSRGHKYSSEHADDGDSRRTPSSMEYDGKSSDSYSEHGSSEEHDDDDDDDPAAPIDVI